MSSDINKVILIARLTRDVEPKYTASGTAVANFSVASNYSYGSGDNKKEQVSFFSCIAWGKLGEIMIEYCKKGQRICIEGRLQQRSWEDQNGNKRSTVKIVVDAFQFLDSKNSVSDTSQKIEDNFCEKNNPFSDDIPF